MINKEKIDEFINSAIRIFNVSRKPSTQEYTMMVKVIGAGIIVIGIIGFIVKLVLQLII